MNRLDELVRSTLDDRAVEAPPPTPVVNRVLADSPRRGRRRWLVAAAAAAVAVTSVGIGVGLGGGTEPAREATPSVSSSNHQPTAADERAVAVYAAALEHFLRKSFDGPPRGELPEEVLVAIRPEQTAGWEFETDPKPGEPLPPAVRDAISAELADLTTLTWVEELPLPSPDAPQRQPSTSVTLGLLPDGNQIRVSVSAFHGHNLGWLTTYVVRNTDGQWSVTGTAGPQGIT